MPVLICSIPLRMCVDPPDSFAGADGPVKALPRSLLLKQSSDAAAARTVPHSEKNRARPLLGSQPACENRRSQLAEVPHAGRIPCVASDHDAERCEPAPLAERRL